MISVPFVKLRMLIQGIPLPKKFQKECSLKRCILSRRFQLFLSTTTHFTIPAYFITSDDHQIYFPAILNIFSPNTPHFGQSLLKQTFQGYQPKKYYKETKSPDHFNYAKYGTV